MPTFPKKEAEIAALADRLVNGFKTNLALFPAMPVSWSLLNMRKIIFLSKRNSAIAAQATAEQAIADKDAAFEELVDALKSDLRYAENTVNLDDDKLKLLGWAGRKSASALTPPGQLRLLEAPKQGEGWVFLDWKAPADGGVPAAYKVLRRERPEGPWQDVATAVASETTLVEQPLKTELEYRVVAVNKAGDGEPSNTVMAVL